ncbi:hypothetical protein VCA_003304 [Vibrio albensis VL426]|nr:hypothetical protein VCA_003304 [Vibrio cholerae VL426]
MVFELNKLFYQTFEKQVTLLAQILNTSAIVLI